MKATYRTEAGKQGAALVTMMIVLLLVCLASAALVAFATQQSHAAGRIRDYMKAQAYAEAGINEAYNTIKTNFSLASNAGLFPATDFEDGGYDVTVTTVGDDQASLVSVGTCGDATITVKADVKNFGRGTAGSEPQPTDPYAYTWLVNGEMRMNGTSEFVGYLHANNNIDVNGTSDWGTPTGEVYASASVDVRFSGPCTLYGEIRSPAIDGSFSPGSAIETASPLVPIPELDLTAFYNIALANGQVVGSQTISSDTIWTIPGGVKWVNGNLTVKSNRKLTWTGCIIATGSIDFKGQLHATQYLDYPTIVSRDSSITVSGSHTFNGLMYSGGDITFNGAGTCRGTILCGGNLRFNGSGARFSYVYCGPGAGGGQQAEEADRVVITAWQK
ncbi:MAG: hypothetical protein KA248_03075 [Kiritimatiellae bacterium]|nr:hypothetical protein [Kiritimatiellia bacterium]